MKPNALIVREIIFSIFCLMFSMFHAQLSTVKKFYRMVDTDMRVLDRKAQFTKMDNSPIKKSTSFCKP